MSAKTPEQIVDGLLRRNDDGLYVLSEGEQTTYGIPEQAADLARRAMIASILADRNQRGVFEALADVIEARAEEWGDEQGVGASQRRAAAHLRDHAGPVEWERFIEPLLDDIESALGVPTCPNCGEDALEPDTRTGLEGFCDSCVHNAIRSGFTPGEA